MEFLIKTRSSDDVQEDSKSVKFLIESLSTFGDIREMDKTSLLFIPHADKWTAELTLAKLLKPEMTDEKFIEEQLQSIYQFIAVDAVVFVPTDREMSAICFMNDPDTDNHPWYGSYSLRSIAMGLCRIYSVFASRDTPMKLRIVYEYTF